MLKLCKTKKCQNKLQWLQWKEQGREEYHVKVERQVRIGCRCNENKKQPVARDCQE